MTDTDYLDLFVKNQKNMLQDKQEILDELTSLNGEVKKLDEQKKVLLEKIECLKDKFSGNYEFKKSKPGATCTLVGNSSCIKPKPGATCTLVGTPETFHLKPKEKVQVFGKGLQENGKRKRDEKEQEIGKRAEIVQEQVQENDGKKAENEKKVKEQEEIEKRKSDACWRCGALDHWLQCPVKMQDKI